MTKSRAGSISAHHLHHDVYLRVAKNVLHPFGELVLLDLHETRVIERAHRDLLDLDVATGAIGDDFPVAGEDPRHAGTHRTAADLPDH